MAVEIEYFAPLKERIASQEKRRTYIKKDMMLNGKTNDTGARHSLAVQNLVSDLVAIYGKPDLPEVSAFWLTYLECETPEQATMHILGHVQGYDAGKIGDLMNVLHFAATGNVVEKNNKAYLEKVAKQEAKEESDRLAAENKRLADKLARIEQEANAKIAKAKGEKPVSEPTNPNGLPMPALEKPLEGPKVEAPLAPHKADTPAPVSAPVSAPAPVEVPVSKVHEVLALLASLDLTVQELQAVQQAVSAMIGGKTATVQKAA